MSRHYFKSSYRNLVKNKLHTSLIIFGLTISMAAFILVSMYVNDELKYDRHYDKADRIYKITSEVNSSSANTLFASTDGYLGQRMKESYPEVEEAVEMSRIQGKTIVHYEAQSFQEAGLYCAERTYFNMFSHKWIEGNKSTALASPKKIVLTRKLARKYFGEQPGLNKVLKIWEDDFTVSGVVEDLPSHTDLKFDALLSTEKTYLVETNYWCITFILFKNKDSAEGFEPKLNQASKEILQREVAATDAKMVYHMEALQDVHFGKPKSFDTPKSSRSNIYIFSLVAFFILFIACVNYANLATVQVIKRNSEAGIRKIMGALSSQLVKQYVLESFIVCTVSLVLAVMLASLSLGFLNQLTGKQLSAEQFVNWSFLLLFVSAVIVISLLAGSYPAMLLSSAKPALALKDQSEVIKTNRLRNVLIVFQFTASIALVICTKVVYEQWNLLIKTDPGFTKEQVLVVDIPGDRSLFKLMPGIKNDIDALTDVKSTSFVGYNSLPTSPPDLDGYEVEYNTENVTRVFNNITVDAGYMNLLEIDIKEGRNFIENLSEENASDILVNESLVAAMNWDHPLEQTLYQNSEEYTVVGVVKDFHFNSLRKRIEPMVIHGGVQSPEKLLVKVRNADFQTIQSIEEVWRKVMKSNPEIEFLDSYFNEQYKNEETMQQVLQHFSVFTLIIACLGLFGLVAISTAQKTKEFGIRKVLGARFPNIASLILKEYLWLVGLASLLSIPIAWWCMTMWLREFAYRTSLAISDFVWPVLITFVVTIISMAYHTIRASHINPVDSIRQG